MSLQPGINPLDRRMSPGYRTPDSFSPRPGRGIGHLGLTEEQKAKMRVPLPQSYVDRAKQADFEQHMQNTGGFDPSSLMSAPQLRQDATMNQANMVSSPYFEANEKAAEKTNPMNAASQEPGKSFLMKFIGK